MDVFTQRLLVECTLHFEIFFCNYKRQYIAGCDVVIGIVKFIIAAAHSSTKSLVLDIFNV